MAGRRRPIVPSRLAALAVAAGVILATAARLAAPGAPPLYDGVVPLEPYLWVNPPPGQAHGPNGATAEVPVEGGQSPLVAVATTELQPQAQVFATPGALVLPPGAKTVKVSIEPLAVTVKPASGYISGNVYRILVTDDKGQAISAPAEAKVSVVLRSADPTLASASMGLLVNGAWQEEPVSPGGFGGTFIAVVTKFGDFAVIASGSDPFASGVPPSSGASGSPGATSPAGPTAPPPASDGPLGGILGSRAWLIGGIGLLIVAVVLTGVVSDRRRRAQERARKRGWRR